MTKRIISLCVCLCSMAIMHAKAKHDLQELPAYKAYFDSIKAMEYKYPLPILGAKAYQRGYDLPYAWGASAVYFTQSQLINISEISLGINGGELVDFSDFIGFGPTTAVTNAYTFRPDVWVLPFLNLYGIVGAGTTETGVTLLEPISFETTQNFTASSFGIGATLAGRWGPVLLIWDNNYNFVDVDVIVEPVPAFNSSLRIGHNFMDPRRPDRMLTVWTGAFYQKINSNTRGSISVGDIFPSIGTGKNIEHLRDWASELPPGQRVIANQIIDKLEEFNDGHDVEDATIEYNLQKEVAQPLNLILGAQYQLNKNWMFRTEIGVFGKRSQFLMNLNYRFQGFVPRR